jgi:Tudor domain
MMVAGIECVVRKDPSDEWKRGIVRKIPRELQTRDDKFEVMAVDYGTIFFVSRRNILRYPDEVKMRFTETPPLAIPCRLHGLSRWWTGKTTIEEQRREISHVLRFGEQ